MKKEFIKQLNNCDGNHDHGIQKIKKEESELDPSYSFSSDTSGGPIDISKKKVRPVIRDLEE